MTKGQRTRKRSVAEDGSLFNRRGFEAGSMSMLMEATGLERGGIYRHFSSKEEVAAEAFDYAWTLTLGVHQTVRYPGHEIGVRSVLHNQFADESKVARHGYHPAPDTLLQVSPKAGINFLFRASAQIRDDVRVPGYVVRAGEGSERARARLQNGRRPCGSSAQSASSPHRSARRPRPCRHGSTQ